MADFFNRINQKRPVAKTGIKLRMDIDFAFKTRAIGFVFTRQTINPDIWARALRCLIAKYVIGAATIRVVKVPRNALSLPSATRR